MSKKILGILCGLFLGQQAMAETAITTPTVSGTWSLANAPYLIYNDIAVPINNTLIIEPGVEVIFMGNYSIMVNGSISAVGNAEQKITFKANDTLGWENFNNSDGGWGGLYIGLYNESNINQPSFEYCIFRDIKSLQNSGLATSCPEMYINECLFYKNYTAGGVLSMASFGGNIQSKLKFTNNKVYDNYSNTTMTSLFTDSIIIANNQFYNNQTEFGVYTNNTLDEDNDMVLVLQHNEMYNNTVSNNSGVLNCHPGGHAFISNNKIHHNQTTLKGALSVGSKTAIIEKNLIANNTRMQKEGFFCGINDGGAGLHLLGQTVISDVPGRNIYTVRNNIIANNHSDINGGGIWVQHCKAAIVNNTIINNTSNEWGAGIHGWGSHCQLQIHNNIIHGNIAVVQAYDTGRYNFDFYTQTLNITDNLIDHAYSNPPPMVEGLTANTYDTDLVLANATIGAGTAYDALTADFSPTDGSINLINQGNNSAADFGSSDYLDNPRIIDQTVDMGAIEFQGKGTVIADQVTVAGLNVYPVPAKQVLNVENKSGKTIKAVYLFNSLGQQMIVNHTGDNALVQLVIKNIAAGQYFVQLSFSDGQKLTKAFVVQ